MANQNGIVNNENGQNDAPQNQPKMGLKGLLQKAHRKYDEIRYDEVLAKRLGVMDLTATSLAMDNNIPVYVFALKDPKNILRAAAGENVGTLVH